MWPVNLTDCELPVQGRGTVSFTLNGIAPFRIVLGAQPDTRGTLFVLEVGSTCTALRTDSGTSEHAVIARTTDPRALLDVDSAVSYWLSIDATNACVRSGKGEMLPEFAVFEVSLTDDAGAFGEPAAGLNQGRLSDIRASLRALRHVGLAIAANQLPPEFLAHFLWLMPVVSAPSPKLARADLPSAEHPALDEAAVGANAPAICHALYASLASVAIELDTEFSGLLGRDRAQHRDARLYLPRAASTKSRRNR